MKLLFSILAMYLILGELLNWCTKDCPVKFIKRRKNDKKL
jgi:hypothetical protein